MFSSTLKCITAIIIFVFSFSIICEEEISIDNSKFYRFKNAEQEWRNSFDAWAKENPDLFKLLEARRTPSKGSDEIAQKIESPVETPSLNETSSSENKQEYESHKEIAEEKWQESEWVKPIEYSATTSEENRTFLEYDTENVEKNLNEAELLREIAEIQNYETLNTNDYLSDLDHNEESVFEHIEETAKFPNEYLEVPIEVFLIDDKTIPEYLQEDTIENIAEAEFFPEIAEGNSNTDEWKETEWTSPYEYSIDPFEAPLLENEISQKTQEDVTENIKKAETIQKAAEDTYNKFYRFKIGDSFQIEVYGEMGSRRKVTIDFNGEFSYLTEKSVEAKGKTVEELREDLKKALSTYYNDPLIIITPQIFANEYFTILGEVRNPGVKAFIGYPTVLTALSMGGGFTTRIFRDQTIDQSDLDRSFLVRNGEYIPVNFHALLNDGDLSQDVPLKPGDYIYIPPRNLARVYVVGEVGSPSSITFLDSITLSQAIAEAGGALRFASSRVAVIRGPLFCPERYLIDFNRIKKGLALDFPLMSGDIVYVPAMQYTTFKEIARAGILSFVSIIFSIAGTNAFFAIQPNAAVTNVIAPIPVINPTVGIINPVINPVVAP
jgi:polysaccharide export outer membrane protein